MDEVTALEKFDKLACKLANYYCERNNGRFEYEDLYQAARLGILQAARTFDEGQAKFITHAWNCGKNSVKKYLRDNNGLIQVPQTASETNQVTVIDSASAETLLEFKSAPDDINALEDNIALTDALQQIPEAQRNVVMLVFFESKTYEEAAEELDVSRQYAHQLTKAGLKNLRNVLGDSLSVH